MRIPLLASAALLALSATVVAASATPVPYIDTMPGSTTFTVPETGTYNILAFGAQGGSGLPGFGTGGLGAEIGGDSLLTAGDLLTIVVGGLGSNGILNPIPDAFQEGSGGGGGGSFVVGPNSTPLVIAGGGGGGGSDGAGGSGRTGTSGQGGDFGGSNGGVNGSGGPGAGGGGGSTLPAAANKAAAVADTRISSGGGGEYRIGGNGGFGGGGDGFTGGGGPVGSGGSGGGTRLGFDLGSGGGGSFDAGLINADLTFVAGVNSGNGSVTITELPSNPIPEPASLTLLGIGLAGLLASRRQAR